MTHKRLLLVLAAAALAAVITLVACSLRRQTTVAVSASSASPTIVFNADSAYAFCLAQCAFGPRTMNSAAHDSCGVWIKEMFARYGATVESHRCELTGYDGTTLRAENIIAHCYPSLRRRLLIAAHWDSRPWADNDPDSANHHTPILAANDGASGVAVLLELARILAADSLALTTGIDFICFDAEDYGTPQWAETTANSADTWALGATAWATQYQQQSSHAEDYAFAIVLDMVGGEGARFYKEQFSQYYAPQVVANVWSTAQQAGYDTFFTSADGTYVTDDHLPLNTIAAIPTIDIIAYYPDCPQSSFGPTWHTLADTPAHLSRATLKAVGQTLANLITQQ